MALLIKSLEVSAQVYNPIQMDLDFIPESSHSKKLEWSSNIQENYSHVRVKVFPHNSSYNAPHGKDISVDRLNLSSSGECLIYKSDYSSSAHGIERNNLIRSGYSFELTTATVTYPIWIECAQPVELIRPDFLNKPIKYMGVLFIKKVNVETPYLTVVNVLPFEKYLKGVVPSEMPASWPTEALKAQAIAARTYAYYELITDVASRDKNILLEESGAQMDDTVTYQAYLGLKNNALSTNKAIEETTGRIMTYGNQVVKAFFHADSGGHTENAENVWGQFYPYILGKKEIYPEGSIPGTSWNYTVKIKDIETKLIKEGVLLQGDELETLYIENEDLLPSGRPKSIGLSLADGVHKKIESVKYSYINHLKSSWISFSRVDESQSIVINGKGFGHGAGMSQWGARIMADRLKMNHQDILKFYYTDVKIEP